MPLPPGVYRADQVGSFLRPKAVLDNRNDAADGKITPAKLREVEDEHVAAVVKDQVENGIRSVTDGEFRRAYFVGHPFYFPSRSLTETMRDVPS